MWYSGTKMRKILPFLVLLIFFTSLEAKSEDYYIEEKTSDYVIVVNKKGLFSLIRAIKAVVVSKQSQLLISS